MASGGEKVLGSEYKLVLDMVHSFIYMLTTKKDMMVETRERQEIVFTKYYAHMEDEKQLIVFQRCCIYPGTSLN